LKAVEFLGYVENMIKIYQDTAIVCLPSYREGFSRVLQEAAAAGLPIVTTNVIGCKDSIIPNKTGLIAKVKDYKSLRDKLKILILDKNKRLKFGKNGRKLAEKEFDLKNVLKANLNICNYLINNAKDNRRL
jgi:glycosyltransferase involved in cell wall biosynthesis